jgi:hypothetical protein
MAASFPVMAASLAVVIASDQSAVAENLAQIDGAQVAKYTTGGVFTGTAKQVISGDVTPANAVGGGQGINTPRYVAVLQRPTMSLLSARVSVIVAGGILIGAPGVGNSIVLRKLRFSVSAAALAADVIVFGTTLTGNNLARFEIPVGAAAQPQQNDYALDWDDYLIGDNLPVDVSSNVATFTNVSIMITYSVVITLNWPLG